MYLRICQSCEQLTLWLKRWVDHPFIQSLWSNSRSFQQFFYVAKYIDLIKENNEQELNEMSKM